MSIGLSSIVAGQIVGKGPDGKLTGYTLAGIIAVVCTAASMLLASHLRVPQEVPETSVAVDPLDESPSQAAGEMVEVAPFSSVEPI